ncbi:VPA1262 family protein [Hahella sp. HN01]|uniref:VPA1262 family protein n=1 Tax=Hahella sp. HN01 TaxID=2847262 RepID=UPI001C1EF99E|nr:VPA1262 family protein [Hahella sp. HN01]MBU6950984.1 hypothetical protein [Hahella sp. HN01]
MDITIDTVFEDYRLKPLFDDESKCALQLWVLQKKDRSSRLVYGWVVPYHFSNNSWSAPNEDKFKNISGEEVQVICLSSYLNAKEIKSFLGLMYSGSSIEEASNRSEIAMKKVFRERFGNLKLDECKVLKPVTYLPSRDNYEHRGLFSPYSGAGANSASIISLQKETFIQSDGRVLDELYRYISSEIKLDTGLDLSKKDAPRIGDLEILSFPTIDEYCRSKLEIIDSQNGVKINYHPDRHEEFISYVLKVEHINNNQAFQANIIANEYHNENKISFNVRINQDWKKSVDGRVIELFGQKRDCNECFLIFSQKYNFIREISLSVSPVYFSGVIENSWLTKLTKLNDGNDRVKAAQSVTKCSRRQTSTISTRDPDLWVNEQRKIERLVAREFPEKTEGKFFPHHTEGEGRLEFVEWWKSLFNKHAGDDFIIFDPYFESVGVDLIARYADNGSNVVILTSNKNKNIDKIKISVEAMKDILSSSCIKVYKVSEIHDRYLLIADKKGRIKKGFSLSNSIQKANENFPLLVTSIDGEIIPHVNRYIEGVLAGEGSLTLAFCSRDYLKKKSSLSLDEKKKKSKEINKSISCENVSAALEAVEDAELFSCWDDLSLLIANTDTGSFFSADAAFSQKALDKIFIYLDGRFKNAAEIVSNSMTMPGTYSYFEASLDVLLRNLIDIDRDGFIQYYKIDGLSWGDYYAIKILYQYETEKFIALLENDLIPSLSSKKTRKKLDLIAHCISEISTSCHRKSTKFQMEILISSELPVLKFIAFSYIEIKLNETQDAAVFLSIIDRVDKKTQIQFIGWLLNRNLHGGSDPEWAKDIIEYLINTAISKYPTDDDVTHIVDSMRGRMRELGYISSWFPEKVLCPLVERYADSKKVFLSIWITELEGRLSKLFELSSYLSKEDVMMTDIAAQLFSISPLKAQSEAINRLAKRLKKVERDIRRPLSPSINWSKWDSSMKLVAWLYGFLNWCQFYSNDGPNNSELTSLTREINRLLEYKPKKVWLSESRKNNLWYVFFDNPAT